MREQCRERFLLGHAPAHGDGIADHDDLGPVQRRLLVADAERVHAEFVRELPLGEDEAAGAEGVEELGIVAREAIDSHAFPQ